MHLALNCLNQEVVVTSCQISLARMSHMALLSYWESWKHSFLLCPGSSIRFVEQLSHLFHVISGLTAA